MVAVAVASRSSFIDRVYDLLERADCRRADSDSEREAIFRLRYDAYLREGAIAPRDERRLADAYDDADNALIFGVHVDGELASSIRLTVASDEFPELPARQVFSDILLPELQQGKIIVDPTRFVADHRRNKGLPELPYVTVRLAWAATEYFQADLLLATVRAEHQAFYKRTFGHRVVCDPRPYPNLKKPISLMVVEYPSQRDSVLRRYPFFRSSAAERRDLFERHPAVVPAHVVAA